MWRYPISRTRQQELRSLIEEKEKLALENADRS
jgi:hypothetical protein